MLGVGRVGSGSCWEWAGGEEAPLGRGPPQPSPHLQTCPWTPLGGLDSLPARMPLQGPCIGPPGEGEAGSGSLGCLHVWPCPHLAGGLPGWLLWRPGLHVPRSRYGLRRERHCLWGVGVRVSVRWAGSRVLTSVKRLIGAGYSLKDLTCVSSLGPRGNLVR